MNDREQAISDLEDCAPWQPETPAEQVRWILAHPGLVLRALGMEQWQTAATFDRALWVEPPTDQGENDG